MIADMPRPRLPYVLRETTRHGRTVWYFRRGEGSRVRLPDDYGSDDFMAAYTAALNGKTLIRKHRAEPASGSVAWLIRRYKESAKYAALAPTTRAVRDRLLAAVEESAGDAPITAITRRAVQEGFDRRRAKPEAANSWLKTMRQLLSYAVTLDLLPTNPASSVTLNRSRTGGHHVWTVEEIEAFEQSWPVGTRERLAFDLLVCTGLRRSDVVRIGRQHVRNDVLSIRPVKTERTSRVIVHVRITQPLADSIAATRTGDLAFLVTAQGAPFTANGFGNWFREACRAAGVPGSAHGIRKAAATRDAENGASAHQLMARYGWVTLAEAELYTRDADRRRLAIGE